MLAQAIIPPFPQGTSNDGDGEKLHFHQNQLCSKTEIGATNVLELMSCLGLQGLRRGLYRRRWRPTTGIVQIGPCCSSLSEPCTWYLVDLFWWPFKGLMDVFSFFLCYFRVASSRPLSLDAGGQWTELCRLARCCCCSSTETRPLLLRRVCENWLIEGEHSS